MREAGSLGNALQPEGLHQLRAKTQDPTEDDLREVAQQFEAVFVEMMLGQMRETTPGDEIFGGNAEETYRDLFDRQMAVQMSRDGEGLGLADMIEEQLRENAGFETDRTVGSERGLSDYRHSSVPVQPRGDEVAEGAARGRPEGLGGKGADWSGPREFVAALEPEAERTAERLGVPKVALIAQAALETGWGQHVVQDAEGGSSNNLFNIKAQSGGWDGDAVRVPTLEYREGVPEREMADFRAYDSVAESFDDYADFLERNPRYREALEVGQDPEAFVQALEDAGYATDPAYAEKLRRIMDVEGGEGVRAGSETLKLSELRPITE